MVGVVWIPLEHTSPTPSGITGSDTGSTMSAVSKTERLHCCGSAVTCTQHCTAWIVSTLCTTHTQCFQGGVQSLHGRLRHQLLAHPFALQLQLCVSEGVMFYHTTRDCKRKTVSGRTSLNTMPLLYRIHRECLSWSQKFEGKYSQFQLGFRLEASIQALQPLSQRHSQEVC